MCGAVGCKRHGRRSQSTQPERSSAERARRKAAVTAWVAANGHWCPGYLVPPHPSRDLTADHLHPVSLGGDGNGELGVLCRSCNTRKGGRNRVRFPSKRSR
jgi:5-methylcytosine-specific restriction protein A